MSPLQLARRVVRSLGRRIRLPFTRRRAAVATAFALAALATLAAGAHAATHSGGGEHTPAWLFSKLFRAIGTLLIALADWFVSIGR